jgi:hypothetical protein
VTGATLYLGGIVGRVAAIADEKAWLCVEAKQGWQRSCDVSQSRVGYAAAS